ncbi:MAG: nucleotidyltransferase family protein [Spirochaetota bacterium]
MDRSTLLAHLRKTHFAPGDRDRALTHAHAIAEYLKREYGARVIGVGSLFEADRPFRDTSDIDLVVENLPVERFWEASARAAAMTDFSLDVIPLEDANDYMRQVVQTSGVEL